MAATASSAFAASISVATRPNGAAKRDSKPASTSWGEPEAGPGGLRAPGWANIHKHRRGRQKRRYIAGKARLLLNIALSIFID